MTEYVGISRLALPRDCCWVDLAVQVLEPWVFLPGFTCFPGAPQAPWGTRTVWHWLLAQLLWFNCWCYSSTITLTSCLTAMLWLKRTLSKGNFSSKQHSRTCLICRGWTCAVPAPCSRSCPAWMTCVQAAGRGEPARRLGLGFCRKSWRYSIGSHLVRAQSMNQSGFL